MFGVFEFPELSKDIYIYRFRTTKITNRSEKIVIMIDHGVGKTEKFTRLVSNCPGFIQVNVEFLVREDAISDSFAKRFLL